jgi:threonine efflux protein
MPAEIFSLYLPNLLLILSVFVVGAASPGPATLMIMNVAAREGRAAGVILSLGIVTGSVFWAWVAALGLVAALKTSVLFFTAMKMAGGLYLLFLAFRAFRSAIRKSERLETWVTDCTGHMGNTSRFGGRLRCHGRNNRKWTRGYALLLAGLKESR